VDVGFSERPRIVPDAPLCHLTVYYIIRGILLVIFKRKRSIGGHGEGGPSGSIDVLLSLQTKNFRIDHQANDLKSSVYE